MNKKQREWLAGKLGDLGNLGAAVMLFGWVMAKPRPTLWIPFMAGCFWLLCYLVSFTLLKGE